MVYNKIDALSEEAQDLADWEIMSPGAQKYKGYVSISAEKNLNIDLLRAELLKLIKEVHITIFPNYIAPSVF
jgi:50S ribosomal subunit-associated GTPase HflX